MIFAETGTLGAAIVVMVFFSLNVQAAEGATYGIVPYVDPPATGAISGIIGAGGNTGAVGFGLGFRNLSYNQDGLILTYTGSAYSIAEQCGAEHWRTAPTSEAGRGRI